MKVSEMIKHQRIQAGLSQKELAQKLKISKRLLNEIESEKKAATPDQIIHISELFNVPVEQLVKGSNILDKPLIIGYKPSRKDFVKTYLFSARSTPLWVTALAIFISPAHQYWYANIIGLILFILSLMLTIENFARHYDYWMINNEQIGYFENTQFSMSNRRVLSLIFKDDDAELLTKLSYKNVCSAGFYDVRTAPSSRLNQNKILSFITPQSPLFLKIITSDTPKYLNIASNVLTTERRAMFYLSKIQNCFLKQDLPFDDPHDVFNQAQIRDYLN